MASWVDPEQGKKVVQGVPAYYETLQGQSSSYHQPVPPSYAPTAYETFQGQPCCYPPPPGQPSYAPTAYGTFQGQPCCYPPPPVPPSYRSGPHQSRRRFMDGMPLLGGEHYDRSDNLSFCNLGYGWFLFILGFFVVIPWYIGVFLLFCLPHDHRERAGLVACTIAAILFLCAGGWRTSYYVW